MPNDLSARLRDAYIPPDENGDDGFILSRLFPGHLLAAADLIDAQAKEIEDLVSILREIETWFLPETGSPDPLFARVRAAIAKAEKPND